MDKTLEGKIFDCGKKGGFHCIFKAVSLVNHANHNYWVGHEKLLNERRRFNFGVSHKQHCDYLDFVHKGEKVEEAGQKVEDGVEDPVSHPVGEFGVVRFLSSEFGQEEERLVGWVGQVAHQVDENQQSATQNNEQFAVEKVCCEAEHRCQTSQNQT